MKKNNSKQSLSKIEKKLWQLCRKVADVRCDAQNIPPRCFTCDRLVEGVNKQLGHFIPKSTCGAFLKYDMRNLRWQCYNCNINGGGQGAEFYKRLVEENDQNYVDQLFKDKQKIVKAMDKYLELISEYELEIANHNDIL